MPNTSSHPSKGEGMHVTIATEFEDFNQNVSGLVDAC